jgi:hypothetical protein
MYPLVALQVVISVEALGALVALERPIVRSLLLLVRMPQKVRHASCMPAIEALHHSRMYTAD